MLFVVDPSVDEAIASPSHPDHDVACAELERLARARWMRRLIIFVESRELIRHVEVSPRLSLRAKAVLAHVHRSRAFKGDLLRKLSIRVRIVAGRSDPALVDRAGIKEIQISVGRVPHGLFDQAIILAENLTDARCYLIFARAAVSDRSYGLPAVSVSSELRGGGGSATEGEYLRIKRGAERLTVCLLDSDKRTPTTAPSAWRARIVGDDAANPSPISASIVVGVYSIENLLGVDALLQTSWVQDDPARRHAMSRDAAIWKAHDSEPHWRYLALKKGVKCKELRPGNGSEAYWIGNAGYFEGYSSKGCASELANCRHTCDRFPTYSASCAVEFANHYEGVDTMTLRVVLGSVPGSIRAEFRNLVSELIAWCCVGGDTGVAGAG